MESTKNGRGNSKDHPNPNPNHNSSSSDANNNGTNSKKKNQPALTQFFRKQKEDGKQGGSSAHNSNNQQHDSNNSLVVEHQQTHQRQTRQQSQLSQNNRESSQGKSLQNQSSHMGGMNSLLQTPKKKTLDTPGKKRVVTAPTADDQDYMNEVMSLVDKKTGKSHQISSQIQQTQSQPGIDDSAVKRSLRPRKVSNYKQMLEGDPTTLKTIEDEQIEIKRKKREVTHNNKHGDDEDGDVDDDDENMDDAQIERASDDEDDEDFPIGGASARRSARKRTRLQAADANDDEEDVEQEAANSLGDDDLEDAIDDMDNESYTEGGAKRKLKSKAKKQAVVDKKKKKNDGGDKAGLDEDVAGEEETVFIDNLPNDEFDIRRMLKEVKKQIRALEKQFFDEEDSEKEEELKLINNNSKHDEALQAFKENSHLKQFWCIPLSVNVMSLNFDLLAKSQMKQGGRLFDVITIDPPWQLSSANPTRGVAIAYDTLNDKEILNMPFDKLQTDGFLFIWVINAKYRFALEMMEKFGYKLVDEIAWVKQTVNGKIAKGHGYYLQHAKETCLVGVKGNVKGKARFNIESDVIFSQRRGQSQKPEEIYEIAEALVPNGYYLEIFGRRNNLHNGWVTIGNEL